MGGIKEMRPTCVLDFYVHESCQRSGIGKVDILGYVGNIPEIFENRK
jgi:hypothetical protein